jgi:hypothetical protein
MSTTLENNTTQMFKDVNQNLENIKSMQPNVYKLWKVYLYKKHSEYIKSMTDCVSMLNEIDNINKPLSIADLQTLVVLRNISSSRLQQQLYQ